MKKKAFVVFDAYCKPKEISVFPMPKIKILREPKATKSRRKVK